jgi:hypothetical protein
MQWYNEHGIKVDGGVPLSHSEGSAGDWVDEFGVIHKVGVTNVIEEKLTPQQLERAGRLVLAQCVEEADGDEKAGLAAGEALLDTLTNEELARVLEEDRREEQVVMVVLLDGLDTALSTMGASGVALAILNKTEEEPTTALLYGATPATEGQYGFPEVGGIGSATLDTAKEQSRKAARAKARAKAKRSLRRRALRARARARARRKKNETSD